MKIAAVIAIAIASPVAHADDDIAPHPPAAWWLSGELDLDGVGQHGLHSPYAGSNSLQSSDHAEAIAFATVSAGYAFTATTAIVAQGQIVVGSALSSGKGLGAPIDDDFVRAAGATPFLGSVFVDQVIALSSTRIAQPRDPLHLLAALPARRLELRAGRFFAPDWFDDDPGGFANGAIRHDSAWDYPADDRGDTQGLIIEYADRYVRARLGELTMPTTPRGSSIDVHVNEDRNEVAELDARTCILGSPGTAYLGGFLDHAQMGDYDEAIAVYDNMIVPTLDVTQYRAAGSLRSGGFAGYDQHVGDAVRAFVGASVASGDLESFGTTEVDNSVRFGARMRGAWWNRADDDLGIGFATSGLGGEHRQYLALGGNGTLLGDGHLVYGREDVLELYYAARVHPGLDASVHVEAIDHPGFNTERGPALIGLVRISAHI